MIFDIKMGGHFMRKARFVANGNTTRDIASHHTYASAVTPESVRIAFLYTALNDLGVLGCDVSNAYLNAPCLEKIWVHTGPEFGGDEGAVIIVWKALYGLKSSGFSWKKTLVQNPMEMGYSSSIADPDVFICKASKQTGLSTTSSFLLTWTIVCVQATCQKVRKYHGCNQEGLQFLRHRQIIGTISWGKHPKVAIAGWPRSMSHVRTM
jgi:hypothetical protein